MTNSTDLAVVPLDSALAMQSGVSEGQIDRAKAVLTWQHNDPAGLGWPVTLPLELAMGELSAKDICTAYNITRERFAQLAEMPLFQKAYAEAQTLLRQEGMTFRVKARMQSELLLETAYALIHSQTTPSNVKADLIKATWKFAGLEPKDEGGGNQQTLQIQINL